MNSASGATAASTYGGAKAEIWAPEVGLEPPAKTQIQQDAGQRTAGVAPVLKCSVPLLIPR